MTNRKITIRFSVYSPFMSHGGSQEIPQMTTDQVVKASGLAYDETTRDWTKLVVTEHRNRIDAIRWINFQRDWMKDLRIVSQ